VSESRKQQHCEGRQPASARRARSEAESAERGRGRTEKMSTGLDMTTFRRSGSFFSLSLPAFLPPGACGSNGGGLDSSSVMGRYVISHWIVWWQAMGVVVPSCVEGRMWLSLGRRARWCRRYISSLRSVLSGPVLGVCMPLLAPRALSSEILAMLGGLVASRMKTDCAYGGGVTAWSLSTGERSWNAWTILTLIE